jgi:small subunit ribosomal protein S16
MKNGAQPSDSVAQIFKSVGLLDRYERYKAGEDLATLLEEAQLAEAERNQNSKTRRDPVQKKKKAVTEEA